MLCGNHLLYKVHIQQTDCFHAAQSQTCTCQKDLLAVTYRSSTAGPSSALLPKHSLHKSLSSSSCYHTSLTLVRIRCVRFKLCSTGRWQDSLHGHLVQYQQILGHPDACSISQQLCLYNVVQTDATPMVHVLSAFQRFQVWMDSWVHPPQRDLQERPVTLLVKKQI